MNLAGKVWRTIVAGVHRRLVLVRAAEVFGEQTARIWITRPCRQLAGEIPAKLCADRPGTLTVLDALARIEWGTPS